MQMLERWIERAGWSETPERLAAATAAAAAARGLVGFGSGFILG